MTWALVFPGQGSQRPGVLSEIQQRWDVRRTLDEASEVWGAKVVDGLDTPPMLSSTVGTQLTLYVAGVASARAWTDQVGPPEFVAGHSVGAFAAAVISGALSFREGFDLVDMRARMMDRMVGVGHGMSAVVGLSRPMVEEVMGRVVRPGSALELAVVNAADEVVLTGPLAALDRLDVEVTAAARRLDVAVSSHSEALRPVADRLAAQLAHLRSRPLVCGVVGTTRARVLRTSSGVYDELAESVARCVEWQSVTELLVELGIELFACAAPGDVLVRLGERNAPEVRSVAIDQVGPVTARRLAAPRSAAL